MRPVPFVLAVFFDLSEIAGQVPAGEARFRLEAACLDPGEKGYASKPVNPSRNWTGGKHRSCS